MIDEHSGSESAVGTAGAGATLAPAAPANDNGGASDSSAVQATCDLPGELGILPGEAALVARFLARLVSMAANDNGEEL